MPKRQSVPGRRRRWCFTKNNPSEEDIVFFASLPFKDAASHYVCQQEVGVGGTPHVQGYVAFKNAKGFKAVKVLLLDSHIEAAKGTQERNFEYCTKTEGRIAGPWSHGFPAPVVVLTDDELWPWQRRLVDLLRAPPNDRSVYWIWEPEGNRGKSALVLKLAVELNALLVGLPAGDAKCAIKLAWAPDVPTVPVIMFDLPRRCKQIALWPLLERLKSRVIFSGKYESGQMILPCVHVVVFSNEPPLRCTLSHDKLKCFRIDHALDMVEWNYDRSALAPVFYGPGF